MNSPCSKLQGITLASLNSADGKEIVKFLSIPPASSRELKFRFDSSPFEPSAKIYKSSVKWCKELGGRDSILMYGVGVKFI